MPHDSRITTHDPGIEESPHKVKTGLLRIWNAFVYSLSGLAAAYRHEDAFRQEVLLAVILIPAAFFVPASGAGRALMIGAVLLVLIVELLNSAVEAAVDRISWEQAQTLEYRPAVLGERFGPLWATYWFRVRATVPEEWRGGRVDLLFVGREQHRPGFAQVFRLDRADARRRRFGRAPHHLKGSARYARSGWFSRSP